MKYNVLQNVVKQTDNLYSQNLRLKSRTHAVNPKQRKLNHFDDLKTHAKRVNTMVGEFIGL